MSSIFVRRRFNRLYPLRQLGNSLGKHPTPLRIERFSKNVLANPKNNRYYETKSK